MAAQSEQRQYSVPALDKGLDILELLAGRPEGLSLKQIADAIGRTPTEIFRMLNHLHGRGYVLRHEPGGVYRLSLRLFELAHRFPPTARLLEVAIPAMRQLSDQTEQSCHLSVLHEQGILVIGQTESPAKLHFSVRLGATFPAVETASGRVLLAFLDAESRSEWFSTSGEKSGARMTRALKSQLEVIRERGYEEVSHENFQGVTDVGCPIVGHTRTVLAALTIPVLLSERRRPAMDFIRQQLIQAAANISAQLGGPTPVAKSRKT
jgi:DNA-binding IclR family transcriptional regulator